MTAPNNHRPGLLDGRYYDRIQQAVSQVEGQGGSYVTPIGSPARDGYLLPLPTIFPFQIYQADGSVLDDESSSTDTSVSDWRTVRVRNGTINFQHPVSTGDDNFSDDTDEVKKNTFIVLDEELHYAPIWLDCEIETDPFPDDGTQGDVTGVTINVGQEGWENYPREPAGDSDTGSPPSHFYILIGQVSTTTDGDPDNPDPQDRILTIHQPQTVNSSFELTMEAFGAIQCGVNGLFTQNRMVLRAL